jgi:glutathione S-transferase
MYAEGFSDTGKVFNCIQRGHQQALETYPQFVVLSLIGGFQYPASVALGGLLWAYARLKWAEGYGTGTPSNRYSHWSSYGIWTSLLIQLFATVSLTYLYYFYILLNYFLFVNLYLYFYIYKDWSWFSYGRLHLNLESK